MITITYYTEKSLTPYTWTIAQGKQPEHNIDSESAVEMIANLKDNREYDHTHYNGLCIKEYRFEPNTL